jgi:hypothetical protein
MSRESPVVSRPVPSVKLKGNRRLSVGSFAASLVLTLVCYLAAGPTLGLFFGGFFVAAFLAPVNWNSAAAGIALIWFIPLFNTSDTGAEWLKLVFLLSAFCAALGALSFFLRRIGFHPTFAAAVATIFALAWLTWPIWLSPEIPVLSDRLIFNLVTLHPPLVANGILHNEPPWTERLISYQLTRLDQDTPVHLPTTIWPAAGLHWAIAAVFFVLGCGID